ncbi:MAG: phosphonopyruvate decarboxylase, partial [Methyloligellaceae bacterium]
VYGEGQPWQMPMGQAVRPVLEAMGVLCFDVTRPEEVQPAVENALTLAYRTNSRTAILLTQQLIGAKKFTA